MGRGRPPKVVAEEPLEYYGLLDLGWSPEDLNSGSRLQDQINIEAICYRIAHKPEEGGLGKFGHFKNYVDLLWNNPDLSGNKKFIWNSWSDKMIREACDWDLLGVAGCTSAGKSGPFALWTVAQYLIDPRGTKCLVMSTSLKGAKNRIWKDVMEFWNAIPNLPGKLLRATNEIQGLDPSGNGYGNSTGLELLATEKSSEGSSLDKLIGIKSPKIGAPGSTYEELIRQPEYSDLLDMFGEEQARDLVQRLQAVSENRIGKLIVVVDEATGAAEGVFNAIMANLVPGNAGSVQVIFLGNPNGHFCSFAKFCEPSVGWDGVTVNDEQWETKIGGLCIRFNAEKNPRIVEGNEKLFWMPRQKDIDDMERKYGRESLFFYRMVVGFWAPRGVGSGVYSEADFIYTGALEKKVIWGFKPPVRHCGFDPAYSLDGDRASATFGLLGYTPEGLHVLLVEEVITIKADITNLDVPIPYQLVRNWRRECEKRGVLPEHACFDATGGGITFAAIVHTQWSSAVRPISSGGKASKLPIGSEKGPDGKPLTGADRYANKATEIWYRAHPFLRSGQIKGITTELAKEICSRQHEKGAGDGRTLKIENKRLYRAREKNSPDDSDSFFLLVDDCETRHGFKPGEKSIPAASVNGAGTGTWKAFCNKARRITANRSLS